MSQFLQSVRSEIRLRGYSLKTEKTYITWIKRFIYFTNKRHSKDCGAVEVRAYLSSLANEHHVAINTQKIALNALAFLYDKVLCTPFGELGFTLATKPRRLPTVLSVSEDNAILGCLTGQNRLAVALMYGSGLRVSECLQLRVQDIDFEHLSLTVHNGKGGKDRQTLLSSQLTEPLKLAIKRGIGIQAKDKEMGVGSSLPYQLGKKYKNAAFSASWAFIFPSVNHCYHPVTGVLCRHHLHTSVIQKATKVAAIRANIHNKRVTCHA